MWTAHPHADRQGAARRLARPRGRFILIVPPLIQMLHLHLRRDAGGEERATWRCSTRTTAPPPATWWPGSRARRTSPRCHRLRGEADIAPAIDSRSVLMVLHIGPDFSRKLAAGQPATVQLILDGRRSNAAQIVAGYAAGHHRRLRPRAGPGTARPGAGQHAWSPRVWFNPNLETTWNTVPSLVAILTTLMGLVVTALSVARERELGTFEQLLVVAAAAGRDRRRQDGAGLADRPGRGDHDARWWACCVVRVPLHGSVALALRRHDGVPGRGDRRRPVHLLAGQDAAAGDPGRVRLHGAGDARCRASPARSRTCPTGSRRLTLANPVRYLPGDRQGSVPEGHARGGGAAATCGRWP